MSHFAKIENGVVIQVIVAEQNFIGTLPDKDNCIQTSYNTFQNKHPENRPLRGNYAGIGYVYDSDNDVFYMAQPFQSWVLNHNIWAWEPPIPYPNDGKMYNWDESIKNWVLIK